MEAKDLMIGDWVYNHQKRECVIAEIHKTSCYLITDFYGNGIIGKSYSSIDSLEPIPLTTEILEKNGFVRSEVFVEWKYEYEDIYMLWKPFPWLSVLSDGSELKFPCEYVHQLQHALKLCGITKNIIL